jgi:DNA-binding protein Fis
MPIAANICIDILQLIHTESQQPQPHAYESLKQHFEPAFFTALLKYTQGNKSAAARLAGMDSGTLARKLQYYGIRVEKKVVTRLRSPIPLQGQLE